MTDPTITPDVYAVVDRDPNAAFLVEMLDRVGFPPHRITGELVTELLQVVTELAADDKRGPTI